MGEAAGTRATGKRPGLPTAAAPWLVVAGAVLFGAIVLRAELRDVWYPNDASIHASMVRWAAERIRAGHLPFDGWYPYLSLGSARFHQYQSLPHIFTGAVSVVLGPGTFRWSLYLLLVTWPVSVYLGGRLFGFGRWAAAFAALVSPLVVSAPGLGYEWGSYLWRGSGTWAQLWGMWALPLALGLSWRAVGRGRSLALAAVALGICVSLHLLTGYLALLALGVWVVVLPREWRTRVPRAVLVGLGALAASAWMLVPLVSDAAWTIEDEFSRGTFYYDGFGAPKALRWLVTGGLLDEGRLPVLSVLAGIGLLAALSRSRRDDGQRAVLGVGVVAFVLFAGRPTFGFAIDLLPGGGDLFLRRYIAGVHLTLIYLAGIGLAWLASVVAPRVAAWRSQQRLLAAGVSVAAVTGLFLAPAWVERVAYARLDATWIGEQALAEAGTGADFAELVARVEATGPGRVFSASRTEGAGAARIGQVPAYTALLALDVDAVGFTRPTWSLLSGVEHRFDPGRASDPDLFGVRYAILAEGVAAPEGFAATATAGDWVLWEADTGYLALVDTVAPIEVGRENLGARMTSVLDSRLPGEGMLPLLSFGGRPVPEPTLGGGQLPQDPPGRLRDALAAPLDGFFATDVVASRASVVLLKSSFHPRWRATVDGVITPTQMLAPGFVGVWVSPGRHAVTFSYVPYPGYLPLFLVALLGIMALAWLDRRSRLRPIPASGP